MAMPDARMLLGNHEGMMLQALYDPAPEMDRCYDRRKQAIWYSNGGAVTHAYLRPIRKTIRREIFEFLAALPLGYEIQVNG